MSIFKEQSMRLIRKIYPKRENLCPLIVSMVIALIFFLSYYFLGNHFSEVMGIATTILLGLMLVVIMLMAEFAVIKSLFLVAVELSLLIFLAQSYCEVQNRFIAGNEALKNLLVIGLLYIIFLFGRSLYSALREYYKKVGKEPWSKEKIIAVALFLTFAILFIWQIYLVVSPIIFNLCIYR